MFPCFSYVFKLSWCCFFSLFFLFRMLFGTRSLLCRWALQRPRVTISLVFWGNKYEEPELLSWIWRVPSLMAGYGSEFGSYAVFECHTVLTSSLFHLVLHSCPPSAGLFTNHSFSHPSLDYTWSTGLNLGTCMFILDLLLLVNRVLLTSSTFSFDTFSAALFH